MKPNSINAACVLATFFSSQAALAALPPAEITCAIDVVPPPMARCHVTTTPEKVTYWGRFGKPVSTYVTMLDCR